MDFTKAKRYVVTPPLNRIRMRLSSKLLFPIGLSLSALFFGTQPGWSQSSVRVDSFYAPSLGRIKSVSVLLPEPYNPSVRYPVLYLLHGYSGDHTNWASLTKLGTYVDKLRLIVVMPDAENSWYVNSATVDQDRFEDYVMKDLPRHIQQRYSVDTAKQGIAGLSMGGYGAIMLALKHPTRFRFVGSLSGALSYPRAMADTLRTPGRNLLPSLRRAFGERNVDFQNRHDAMLLAQEAARDSLPYFYFVIGTSDGFRDFLPAHRALTDQLRASGAHYEYHETPGGHSWQYWDREIQPLLSRMKSVLAF